MTEPHVPGQTTPTPQRRSQDFTQPVQHMDLDQECTRLLAEAAANASNRAAKTLSKDASMSVEIVAISAGSEIKDHRAHGSSLLHALRGSVTVSLKDSEIELPAGQLVTLASHLDHHLSAKVDSVVLHVIASGH
jgi:quercetin dioxygenase-like cupin family protein